MRTFHVTAEWDGEAGVWVATSDDLPGLVSEAETLERLLDRVKAVAPELIADNGHLIADGDVDGESIELRVVSQLDRVAS